MTGKYDDLLNLPHHKSSVHPAMPIADRAAQFAPFAALTGYDAQVKEAARYTEQKISISEEQKAEINQVLLIIRDALPDSPVVEITYFLKDSHKSGGSYQKFIGTILSIDPLNQFLLTSENRQIPMDEIVAIVIL